MIAQRFTKHFLVRPQDLNHAGTLFGGVMMSLADEMAFIAATLSFPGCTFVTKVFCEFNFIRSVKEGDIVQIEAEVRDKGRSSVRVSVRANNAVTGEEIFQTEAVLVNAKEGRSIAIPEEVAARAAAATVTGGSKIPPRSVMEAGEGVRLRPVSGADTVALFLAAQESIAELSPWMGWCDADYRLEHARSWTSRQEQLWTCGEEFAFLIEEEGTEGAAGTCGLNAIQWDHAFCNLGYWVRTSRTGRSLASRAARRVAQFGFEELGLGRIEIVAATGNLASQRVAEKAGAVREAVLRRRLVVRESAFDAVMFAVTRP